MTLPLTNATPFHTCMQEVAMNDEYEEACAMLVECIELRKKWLFQVGAQPA